MLNTHLHNFPQINVDKFIVGRFTSHTHDGCPDGYMTIAEHASHPGTATSGADTAGATAVSAAVTAAASATASSSSSSSTSSSSAAASSGGQWCGTAWGYNVYYSEGASINVSLHVLRLHQQQGLPDNFAFRLTYKVLRRADAKLR